jgi:hypothetical protein
MLVWRAVPCCAGAEVQRLRPVSITHPEHPVNVARKRAEDVPGAVFADQFENLANLRAHLDTGEPLVCCSPAAKLCQAALCKSSGQDILVALPVGASKSCHPHVTAKQRRFVGLSCDASCMRTCSCSIQGIV